MITTIEQEDQTLADLVHRLGDVSIDRIMLSPAPGLATEADVIRYLEAPRKRICELIDGVLVEKSVGLHKAALGSWIVAELWNFVDEHDSGLVFGADAPICLRIGLVRYPDVCFIAWDKIPDEELPEDAIGNIIPDLAIEVLSRSNTRAEIELKLDHYFEAGVRLAWVVDPATETVAVYSSRRRVKLLDGTGVLDGGTVLPGFKLELTELFASTKRKKQRTR